MHFKKITTFILAGLFALSGCKKAPDEYRLNINVIGAGEVIGATSGTYKKGSEFTLTATPNEGHYFEKWDDASSAPNVDLSKVTYSFVLNENRIVSAFFKEVVPVEYSLTLKVVGNGTISGATSKNYVEGSEIYITANPEIGHNFVRWEDSFKPGDMTIKQISYAFRIYENRTITAYFEEKPVEEVFFTLTLAVEGDGTISGAESGSYAQNTTFTINATPLHSTAKFVHWRVTTEQTILDTNPTFTFTLTEKYTITAVFVIDIGDDLYYATFGHKFNASADFVKEGGTKVINGLTWDFSPFSFLGQNGTVGVQIGSKNNPQRNEWTLSTNFGGYVKLLSFSYTLCGASGNNFDSSVLLGDDYLFKTNNISTTLVTYGKDDLDITTNHFTFKLMAINAAAIYFNSLTFTVGIPKSLVLDISVDQILPKTIIPGDNVPALRFFETKEIYYENVDLTATGETLKTNLRTKVSEITRTSYGEAKTMLIYTDENVNNPGFLYGMWDGDNLDADWTTGTWQREHVLSVSNMGLGGVNRPTETTKNHGTDLHNLRAACASSNGVHADKHFDNEPVGAGYFFPNISLNSLNGDHAYVGDFRGDTARILLYMYIAYDFIDLVENPDGNNNTGKLSTLLSWHALDPVDNFETSRNNRIYSYQGNRNPFIDYPELVSKIDFAI